MSGRGVWLAEPLLEQYGPSPAAAYCAQLAFLTDGSGALIRADSEWDDVHLSRDKARRARCRLRDDGWLTWDLLLHGGVPIPHLRGEAPLHRLWTEHYKPSAKTRNGRGKNAESSSISTNATKQGSLFVQGVTSHPSGLHIPGSGFVPEFVPEHRQRQSVPLEAWNE